MKICEKGDCKNKNSYNCLGCKNNLTIANKDKLFDSYNNKYRIG